MLFIVSQLFPVERLARSFRQHKFKYVVYISILFFAFYGLYNISQGVQGTHSFDDEEVLQRFSQLASTHDLHIDDIVESPQIRTGRFTGRVPPPTSDGVFNRIPESRGETELRRVLSNHFQAPFEKIRPDFLRNEITGRTLELDCCNLELGIAAEYQGAQHYTYTPHFHSSKDAFYNQQYRDRMKRELCEKHGIRLIEVPHTVPVEEIEGFVVAAAARLARSSELPRAPHVVGALSSGTESVDDVMG
jgi:hypothetical protein